MSNDNCLAAIERFLKPAEPLSGLVFARRAQQSLHRCPCWRLFTSLYVPINYKNMQISQLAHGKPG